MKIGKREAKLISRIEKCGFLGLNINGEYWLQDGKHCPQKTAKKLIEGGVLRSNDDALFGAPQSYSISRGA